jgi:type IV pilus biogenesis protein CpaD/CtpE
LTPGGSSPARKGAIAKALAAAGLKKGEIRQGTAAAGAPEEVVLQVRGLRVAKADYHELDDFWLSSASVHPDFGAATNYNLGVQAADPERLFQPAALGRPNPMAAVGAVERYQKGQIRALGDQSLEAAESGGD